MWQLLKPLWATIAKWAGLASIAALFIFKIRESGVDAEKEKEQTKDLQALQKGIEVENNLDNISDTQRDSLCKKWTRN